jgi:signal transduction histidine kinase/CheY-like chemotaxis protein
MEAVSAYGVFAKSRVRDLPTRMGFALFLALSAWVFSHAAAPALWFAAVAATQVVEALVASPILRHPQLDPSAWRKRLYGLSLGLNAAVYSSICVYFWFACGDVGKAFAMLQPAGSLLNISLQLDRSPRALIAAWVPHCVYMLGLPLVAGVVNHDLTPMAVLSAGSLIYVVHVVGAVRSMRKSAASLCAARDLAESQRERAERASAAKSDFLATMSHEIRTPMNGVVSAASLLSATPLNAEQTEHVAMLANSSEVLMGLLNDVLDLSKIESGKLVVEAAPFDLVRKLEASVQLWRPQAEQKGVALDVDVCGLPPHIMTDPLRFQQVVFNLLSNAVKFTDQGHIRMRGGRSASDAGETLWIEIEDTGCGMDAETAARIFETFEQAHPGTTRLFGGTGLGLSISRRLAGLLGGMLSVTSTAGRGSTFRFETPLVEIAAAIKPDERASPAPRAASAQVLLAEDHEVNQRIVRLFLEPAGFEVTTVADGEAAVAAAGQRPYDVILMDMQMPVMGGVEATKLIRSGAGPNASTPIIALTANALEEHQAQWAAVGVEVFMTKPVDARALIENVSRAATVVVAATRTQQTVSRAG